ncbi:toll/interleukin-1 receptor domain-containing protein [Pseudomonas sp. zfem001]|uniref:toll/interleukin-1 receptor domain-containing protein n=1 Tax=Pseudomonas sp. zfem001 TaxID=3078196 RepID=UPI0029285EFE|nr:toll/interleukin-1 receptor domain-containing protein [Pseudomonas sp. zfem001]MDU9408071.1 toll/interleukin-1 receptor domain-containing protein [Pseudomonas sp. zfem001]
MSKKVFISYSHKDEVYREELEEHLSMLRREGEVSVWHDRKITAGDEWKNEIDSNLESAQIVILLISSSFLASDYCHDVELGKAMAMHEEGLATIVAIIIRACDWKRAGFSKYQAVPKDANPVALWADKDSAWLDVVTRLRELISKFKAKEELSQQITLIEESTEISISKFQEQWIEDTEIVLTHRKVDKVRLSDIYVYPDVELDYQPKNKIEIEIVESGKHLKERGLHLVLGEEQQGKTSLLKMLFKEFALEGKLPLYLDAESVSKTDPAKSLEKEVELQYEGLTLEGFKAHPERILLLDNLDRIGLNNKHRNLFVEQVAEQFDWVIATCHSAFNYISAEVPALSGFISSDLLGFGNLKREEVIRKWISLGVEESIQESTLYSRCDELKNQLNSVIKKNIVPPKPIYVLMIMQMFEAYAQQNIDLTSYGHCYQQLIYQSFEKAKINGKDYERYLNVLTEISWRMFLTGGGLNSAQVDGFFEEYGELYLSVDKEETLDKLLAHSILTIKQGRISFKYPYIYYFFVGKKFAEGFSDSQLVQDKVDVLLSELHREDYANILIFITHHTKDSWVLNKIKHVLSELFGGNEKATLTKDQLSFMDEFMKKIPELILEQREIQQERDAENRALDEIERTDAELEADSSETNLNPPDTLANINKSFKGMEIAGQIIRNRHATMTRTALYDLASSGTATGLRFLDYFIKISDSSKKELIKYIAKVLYENPSLSDREVQEHAESTYLHITYGVINGVVRKIAYSIGSKEAYEVYEALENDENTPAYTLINQAVELKFKRVLNIGSIQKTTEKLKNSPVCLRILKELIVQHIYMFPVEYKEKQQLSELLGISVQGQRYMDQKKRGKG